MITNIGTYLVPGLTLSGLLILFYGFFVAFKFRNKLGTGTLAEAWDKLIGLVSLFILGYIVYTAQIVSGEELVNPQIVAALLMFFGSVFVAATAYVNYDAYGI